MAGKREPSFSKNFIAGGLAGTIGAAITCPLEVVKTRLQSNLYEKQKLNPKNFIQYTTGHIKGVVHLLLDIRRQEGFRALWKGLGPNLVGVVPARSIYFSVYQKGKHYYSRMLEQESSLAHVMSAATAGTCTALCTNPIWLIKTRMQLQSEIVHTPGLRIYKNSFDCFKSVLKEEGIRGLYRGFSASLLGLTESTFQFAMYEYMKSSLTKKRNTDSLTWFETTMIASCAKLVAAIGTYPHEVIRTRLRQSPENGVRKYTGIIQSAKLIYRQEGISALYGGMTAHLMRVVPNAAILFLSYEVIIKLIE